MLCDYNNNNKKKIYDLKESILEAAEYYKNKYGYYADTCFVNPITEDIEDIEFEGNKIKILKDKCILPTQLWIGTEDERNLPRCNFSR